MINQERIHALRQAVEQTIAKQRQAITRYCGLQPLINKSNKHRNVLKRSGAPSPRVHGDMRGCDPVAAGIKLFGKITEVVVHTRRRPQGMLLPRSFTTG